MYTETVAERDRLRKINRDYATELRLAAAARRLGAAERHRLRERIVELLTALEELIEVADLRGDADLPNPEDDPILWTTRMQTAWDECRIVLAKAE